MKFVLAGYGSRGDVVWSDKSSVLAPLAEAGRPASGGHDRAVRGR